MCCKSDYIFIDGNVGKGIEGVYINGGFVLICFVVLDKI